jgi:class 3 adenylate cyclase
LAENFESVTIMFSAIIGFDSFVTVSEAVDVVVLLNQIYGTFDAVIEKHQVYKVETIADSYMVCMVTWWHGCLKKKRPFPNYQLNLTENTTILTS